MNAAETETSSTDLLEARHQREHKDVRYFSIPDQVQDEDFSIKKEKNCANIGKTPIIALVLQCCSNCKIGSLQDHGSHTPLQDEGSSLVMDLATGFQTRCELMMDVAPRLQTRRHHRHRNKQLSVLIVNVETDAQTE